MPLPTRRCSDRMVHTPGQEGRILHQAGAMPHRAYRSRTCLGLDLRRNLCVSHQYTPTHRPPWFLFFYFQWLKTVYFFISALCAAMCANHGRKKRRPSPLQLHSARPAISSPVLIYGGQLAEDEGKLGGFTDIPLEQLGDEVPWNPL